MIRHHAAGLAAALAAATLAALPLLAAPVPGLAVKAQWPMVTDTVPACSREDGSQPGQPFPCLWDGATMGNGSGRIYVLTDVDTELPR